MKKFNRKDAETIMGMVGLLTIIELATMEDFLEVMIILEDNISEVSDDSVDYLIYLLKSVHQDI